MILDVTSYTKEYIDKRSNHLYIAPADSLKETVAHYTITFLNENETIPEGSFLHLVPDVSGCFVIVFEPQLYIKVWGPTTKIVSVPNDLNDVPCRFFVEFLPGGLYQVLGVSVKELLDKTYDLKELQNKLSDEILNRVSSAKSFDEIVDIMNEILTQHVSKHPIDKHVLKCIRDIHIHHNTMTSNEVSMQLNVSERQVTRYFNRYIGMGVKKYSKIVNINHLIQNISQKDLLDLTYDYDYFDQSHFNHVFKEICEVTPKNYIERLPEFYNELYKF